MRQRQKWWEARAAEANAALETHGSKVFKTTKVRVGVINGSGDGEQLRLGLLASENVRKEDTVLSIPFRDEDGTGLALNPDLATKVVYKDVLPEGYDGWTGDVGLLALLLLNEMARIDTTNTSGGVNLPKREEDVRTLMAAWIKSLPTPAEMEEVHPLMWAEDEQEVLQSSSTKKIYRLLDDVDDDSKWLEEKVWETDRATFPEEVTLGAGGDGEEDVRPCFTPDGFRYAVAIVRSRASYVDGALRLLPYLDMANHDDDEAFEISGGTIGTLFGSAKGAVLNAGKKLSAGEEVRVSYGPKGPAEYLLDHGFVPPMCRIASSGGSYGGRFGAAVAAELTFVVDESEDRFRDDKLDVLEFETYDLAPMDPSQSYDAAGGPGSTGAPDPAMMQFLRLIKLGGKDAFLLESIFRKEIWEFMAEPVSEANERGVVEAVIDACERALASMDELEVGELSLAVTNAGQMSKLVRESEREALERTLVYMKQENEALDLKEYYQERRLKGLGLDSDWSPEDDDVGFGKVNRVPGGADYDW